MLNRSGGIRVGVCGVILMGVALFARADFTAEEDLGYTVFLPTLRSSWKGVYATFLEFHDNDGGVNPGFNKNHEVSTESTSLLAHLAVLRGDQETLDEILDLWFSESYFHSETYQLAHWLLDKNGNRLGDAYGMNASGEEVRMLEVLKRAQDRFSLGRHDYRLAAQKLAEGLKGINGGQGTFEAPFAAGRDAGEGGAEFLWISTQSARYLRLVGLERATDYGYSLREVEIYGPDGLGPNLALGAHATASSVEGPGTGPEKAVDGDFDTRWSSAFSDSQYLEIDLGEEKVVRKIVLVWEAAYARKYVIDLQPYFEPKDQDAHLLRPWFVWSLEGAPVSSPWDPNRVPLNYNNYVAYHEAATWLGDPFFQRVLDHTLPVVAGAQNTALSSPGQGLFRLQYDLLRHAYFTEEEGKNESATIGACDIATRIGAYGHRVGHSTAMDIGRRYLNFLKARYVRDGVIWGSYDVDTGAPVPPVHSGFVLYTFAAKLAMEYGDFDWAEKLFREQVLPYQVTEPGDPGFSEGYRGAFKAPATLAESRADLWKDAGAFANLETLIALHTWNTTDKGDWVSRAPRWTTVAVARDGDGGEDRVSFPPVTTRYVRVLCRRRATEFGYSLWSLQAFRSDGTDAAAGRPVSISSAESEAYPSANAVDENEGTRWSSAFGLDPQWIYVDLGAETAIHSVRLNWESAYAVDYEIQAAPTEYLGLQPRDALTHAPTDGLHFGNVSAVSNVVCPQYLDVAFAGTAASWGVNIWTNYGGENLGGRSTMGGLHKDFHWDEPTVSLGWQAYENPEAYAAAPPSETSAPTGLDDPDWTFVKSKKDGDWSHAEVGYARILMGTGSGSAVLTGGPGAGRSVTSPVSIYFAAYFAAEKFPAGDYSAQLGCDLYHE